jgi:hypothetical protein
MFAYPSSPALMREGAKPGFPFEQPIPFVDEVIHSGSPQGANKRLIPFVVGDAGNHQVKLTRARDAFSQRLLPKELVASERGWATSQCVNCGLIQCKVVPVSALPSVLVALRLGRCQ